MRADYLGFRMTSGEVHGGIFVPRYYNPEVIARLQQLSVTHDLVPLGRLNEAGQLAVETGDEIGKMAYGTGIIPFIRTSDIANWELKNDPKQGVSEEVYAQYAAKHDVRAGDVLFVRDGTYLIGQACLVTEADAKMLYQSHILKFRASPGAPVSGPLLLALLSASVVRRQIRAKQFTADIIDTIGHRYKELVLPVPRDPNLRRQIAREVEEIVQERVLLRERLRRIPWWVQGAIPDLDAAIPAGLLAEAGELRGNRGFTLTQGEVRKGILVPRYYDPGLDEELAALASTHDLVTLGSLVERGVIEADTGIEVGKMAYGTGPVPFIRTSDLSNWELKADPKHSISAEIYERVRASQDVASEDILLVRDGTYLVGSSCILTERDTPLTYCGGIYKFRVRRRADFDPFLLLAVLNAPTVRRQMRAKQFTRDVIDTLGKRIFEVVLPIPKRPDFRRRVAEVTRDTILRRAELRDAAQRVAVELEGPPLAEAEEAGAA